jgi:hypothetical protein
MAAYATDPQLLPSSSPPSPLLSPSSPLGQSHTQQQRQQQQQRQRLLPAWRVFEAVEAAEDKVGW